MKSKFNKIPLFLIILTLIGCTEVENQYDDIRLNVSKINVNDLSESEDLQNPITFDKTGIKQWIKIDLFCQKDTNAIISFQASAIDTLDVYFDSISSSPDLRFGDRVYSPNLKYDDPYPSFDIKIKADQVKSIYVSVFDKGVINVPIVVYNEKDYRSYLNIRNIFYGIFIGALLALILYNIFIYFASNRLTSYFYYSIFLTFLLITQLSLLGFTNYILNPLPLLNHSIMFIGAGFLGVFGSRFIFEFIDIKVNFPKHRIVFYCIYVSYFAVVVLTILKLEQVSYQILNFNGLVVSIYLIVLLFIAWRKEIRNAKITLIAWSIFFIGVMLFVIKDFGVFSYNPLIAFIMPVGATTAAILLSFALADHINVLQRENEQAQDRIIEELARNENLIKNQNVILEEKVKQRTEELEKTLEDLKKAQVKLIESEKMASLGVLTAGIAHEINNPINYVTANVIPLRENIEIISELLSRYKALSKSKEQEKGLQEIEAYEQEIELDYTLNETDELIDGIEEGAKRTYNIVEGLRTFSRSDSASNQKANINKGLRSTLAILKNELNKISTKINLDPNLPEITCQLGKLNQVFLNLLNNAIHAVEDRHSEDTSNAKIEVLSYQKDNHLAVEISDNGNGIPKDIQNKIFEPFYTSKPVGKGTGLGLSISYAIIEDHKGSISFESEEGVGSTFRIELPIDENP